MNIPQSATRIVETGDRVRILVLGDRGVGKSSLIHMLCHQEPLRDARATTGFHIDVKVYEHQRKRCWIELLEVAGAGKHPMARRCLYAQKKVDGVILVHDPSNRRSYQHLWGWMSEATEAGAFGGGGTSSDSNINVLSTTVASPVLTTSTSNPYAMQRGNIQARRRGNSDMEVRITTEHSNQTPPVLLVGTMADRLEAMSSQHLSHPHGNTRPRRYSIVEEFDGDAVQLCSIAVSHFTNGSTVTERFSRFFDRVIDNKFFRRTAMQSPRMNPSMYAASPPPTSLVPSGSPPLSPRIMPSYPIRSDTSSIATTTAPLTSSSLLFSPITQPPLQQQQQQQQPQQSTLSSANIYANVASNNSNNNGLFVRKSPIPTTVNGGTYSFGATSPTSTTTTTNHTELASTSNHANSSTAPTSGLSNLFTGYTQNTGNLNANYHESPREKRQRMTINNPASSTTMGYIPGSGLMGRKSPRPMAIHTNHSHSTAGMPIAQSQQQQQQQQQHQQHQGSHINQRFGGHSPPVNTMFMNTHHDPLVRAGSPPFRHAPLFGRSPPIHYQQPTGSANQVPVMTPLPPTSPSLSSHYNSVINGRGSPQYGSFKRNLPSAQ